MKITPQVKNIIIVAVVATILILIYIFFFQKSPEEQNLVSSTPTDAKAVAGVLGGNSMITQDFLSLLLSVKSIRLDDKIFSDKAFINLRDSSILLTPIPRGDEGRENPFAPIGFEAATKIQ